MNKLILIAALLIPTIALADHDEWRHRQEHEYRGGGDGWKWLGGAIIGGIIINQIDRDRYAPPPQYVQYPPPMRRVLFCEDIPLFDVYGNVVRYQRQCHYELVPIQ